MLNRRRGAWILVCGALLSATGASAEQATPTGYYIDYAQLAAERSADRVQEDGDFTISIHRKYEDALGAHLLDVAEATYPPREAVISRAIENEAEMGSDSAR